MSGTAPGSAVVTPYEWNADHSGKDRVFTPVRPFRAADPQTP